MFRSVQNYFARKERKEIVAVKSKIISAISTLIDVAFTILKFFTGIFHDDKNKVALFRPQYNI